MGRFVCAKVFKAVSHLPQKGYKKFARIKISKFADVLSDQHLVASYRHLSKGTYWIGTPALLELGAFVDFVAHKISASKPAGHSGTKLASNFNAKLLFIRLKIKDMETMENESNLLLDSGSELSDLRYSFSQVSMYVFRMMHLEEVIALPMV